MPSKAGARVNLRVWIKKVDCVPWNQLKLPAASVGIEEALLIDTVFPSALPSLTEVPAAEIRCALFSFSSPLFLLLAYLTQFISGR